MFGTGNDDGRGSYCVILLLVQDCDKRRIIPSTGTLPELSTTIPQMKVSKTMV